ncbi:MAG: methyltransferase domain-containing protein [Candidatus Kerfeldbacteria bacterium]|nr:methyltransferase domain-containing protein [Candidatus Kerfeldbacteria bacterium]
MPHPPFHCPNCHQPLSTHQLAMTCRSCRATYPVRHGIPQLLHPRFMDSFKESEQHFHDELSASATNRSIASRSSRFHNRFKQPMMELPLGSAVLEVACGTRVDGVEIAAAGQSATALDISPDAVVQAQSLVRQVGLEGRLRLAVSDAEHLPFSDRVFDATFVAASFHHFPNQLSALLEMRRVTKPGGLVIFGVEPQAWPYRTLYRWLGPLKRYIRRRQYRMYNSVADDSTEGYTEPQLRELFRRADLEIQEVSPAKLLSECYDSSVRLLQRLLRRQLHPWAWLDHRLADVDAGLERLPGISKLFWHWNVISRVPV